MNTQALPAVAHEPMPLDTRSAQDLRTRVDLIQEVMHTVMKKDTHYGIIPFTKATKPTLYKAGSEVLNLVFRIAVDPEIEDLSGEDEIRYRVRCKAIYQPTGEFLGAGVGEASTSEDKWRWRAVLCDDEWERTPENRRRIKHKKGERGTTYTERQVRTNPADMGNTVLKMAKKRAQVDMTLTVTGASDIFDQDIGDGEDEGERRTGGREPINPPRRKSGTKPPQSETKSAPRETQGEESPPATENQVGMIRAKLHDAKATAEEFASAFGTPVDDLRMNQVNAALAMIRKGW
jgi:hypothetical protein